MAVLEDEPETPTILHLLNEARLGRRTALVPFIALMEVEYVLLRRVRSEHAAAALSTLENWPVSVVESTAAWRHEAAKIKAGGGLSLADAWVAALATLSDAQLVHKDPEFEKVRGLKSMRL